MALLAESLVDEWLNRAGFFTVRGLKHGVGEIDLLGVRPSPSGLEAWHVEVQASFRPIGYIAPLPKESVAGFAKSKTSMKARPQRLVEAAAQAWVRKKFTSDKKRSARESAWPGLGWHFVLIHAAVRWPAEIDAIHRAGIEVIPLHRVLSDLGQTGVSGIRGSAGTDLSEVIEYFYKHTAAENGDT
jgi:hypothetical protein